MSERMVSARLRAAAGEVRVRSPLDGRRRTQSCLGCPYDRTLLMRSSGGNDGRQVLRRMVGKNRNREISPRGEPSSVIDDLIQATGNAKPVPARKSETPSAGGCPVGANFVKSKRIVFVG